jgi:hypothetical protein
MFVILWGQVRFFSSKPSVGEMAFGSNKADLDFTLTFLSFDIYFLEKE